MAVEIKTPQFIEDWFGFQKELLDVERKKVLSGNILTSSINSYLIGKTINEAIQFLDEVDDELDKMASLNILSNIEAFVIQDYEMRRKQKSIIGKQYGAIHKSILISLSKGKNTRVSLQYNILPVWKNLLTTKKKLIGELDGVLNFRHWLAHGRFWRPNLGRKYDFKICYQISQNINQLLKVL